MMKGECHQYESEVVKAFLDTKKYDGMGIETQWSGGTIQLAHPRVSLSDDFASMLGDVMAATVLELTRRNLTFTHGVPRRQTLLLDEASRDAYMKEFQRDAILYDKLVGSCFKGQEFIVSRSVFQLTSVKQLLACLNADDWTWTPRPPMERTPCISPNPSQSFTRPAALQPSASRAGGGGG